MLASFARCSLEYMYTNHLSPLQLKSGINTVPLVPGGGNWNVGSENKDSTFAIFGLRAFSPHIVREETTRTKFLIAS